MEIARQNRTRSRATGKVPLEVWNHQTLSGLGQMRPVPPATLLDLHLSLRLQRRVNHDHTIDFEGQNYEIADPARRSVTIVHHPRRQFRIIEHSPKDLWPPILAAFTL